MNIKTLVVRDGPFHNKKWTEAAGFALNRVHVKILIDRGSIRFPVGRGRDTRMEFLPGGEASESGLLEVRRRKQEKDKDKRSQRRGVAGKKKKEKNLNALPRRQSTEKPAGGAHSKTADGG